MPPSMHNRAVLMAAAHTVKPFALSTMDEAQKLTLRAQLQVTICLTTAPNLQASVDQARTTTCAPSSDVVTLWKLSSV